MSGEGITPVTVRVGDRKEYVIGHVACDAEGRVRLEQVADLLTAVSEHMRVLVDYAERDDHKEKTDGA